MEYDNSRFHPRDWKCLIQIRVRIPEVDAARRLEVLVSFRGEPMPDVTALGIRAEGPRRIRLDFREG
jgi:hypothetical protein